MNKEELIEFLEELNKESGNKLSDETLKKLTSECIIHSQARPLPSADDAKKSPEFKKFFQNVFENVFKNLQEKQEETKFAKDYLENLTKIVTITSEELSPLKTKMSPIRFNRLNNLLQKNNQEELRAVIKSTLENIISPQVVKEELLRRDDLSTLTQLSLQLHSKRYKEEMENENSSVHIIHFYEGGDQAIDNYLGKPRATEYLSSYDSDNEEDDKITFNKTSHGLGSGIYGLGKLTTEQIDEQLKRNSNYQIVEIKKPLRLNDENPEENKKESALWTELSKYLQSIGNQAKAKQRESRTTGKITREEALKEVIEENKELLQEKASILSEFKSIKLSKEEILNCIISSLEEFLLDSKKDKSFSSLVAMPINYLIRNLGFTGVVSNDNDRFNRGLILTHLEDSYFNWIKVGVKNTVDPLLTVFDTKIKSGMAGQPLKKAKGESTENILTLLKHSLSPKEKNESKKKLKKNNEEDEENLVSSKDKKPYESKSEYKEPDNSPRPTTDDSHIENTEKEDEEEKNQNKM